MNRGNAEANGAETWADLGESHLSRTGDEMRNSPIAGEFLISPYTFRHQEKFNSDQGAGIAPGIGIALGLGTPLSFTSTF